MKHEPVIIVNLLFLCFSEDQCIVIWTYFGGAGSLEVQVWETEPLYGGIDATGTPIESFTIERTGTTF